MLQADSSAIETVTMPSRKRRLTHMSTEEKMYRKKLKNRVAAQTSRDRKKAHMDELESTVSILSQEVESLKKQNSSLTSENTLLRQQLLDAQTTTTALLETLQAEKCSCGKSPKSNDQTVFAGFPSTLSRPAESYRHPLPKGLDEKLAASLSIAKTLLMAFLLSQSSSRTWDLRKTSQISATWKDLLKVSSKKPLPAMRMSQKWNRWWGRHQSSWNPVDQMLSA